MSDLELLTGTISARLRALPGVVRLHPASRPSLSRLGTAGGVLSALVADESVTASLRGDVLEVRVDVSVADEVPATSTALAVVDAVRGVLDGVEVPATRIAVRVVSVEGPLGV
ncbi:hypothetical protein [Amnibacterium endophyticum]|uniref:Asp23/Gls24 family envelope stress response protein n=1 Tax=Amnibacterium endophyticum TaxID=2109337 RepID=A0ABW4LDE6_9MICO